MQQLDLEKNQQTFEAIFNGEIFREGKDELLQWLKESDFFTMPATGQYTLSCKGGGCQHALNAYKALYEMVEKYRANDRSYLLDLPENPTEEDYQAAEKDLYQSIAIIGLLHDVCNANSWVDTFRNVQQPDGKWIKKPGYKWEEEFIFGHGAKSVFIIQQFIRLYIEEAQAIRFHAQGKEIPYGTQIEDTFYGVYETTPLAAIAGAAINEASIVADKIIWDKVKPE